MEQNEKKIKKQSRWRSWALWSSLAALTVVVANAIFGFDVSDTAEKIAGALLTAFVAFGIINNPTSSNSL